MQMGVILVVCIYIATCETHFYLTVACVLTSFNKHFSSKQISFLQCLCLFPVSNCRLENESTRKEAAGSAPDPGRGTCQGSQRCPKEDPESDTRTIWIPESQRYTVGTAPSDRLYIRLQINTHNVYNVHLQNNLTNSLNPFTNSDMYVLKAKHLISQNVTKSIMWSNCCWTFGHYPSYKPYYKTHRPPRNKLLSPQLQRF